MNKEDLQRFLRELAKYEGQNTLKDWYGLPFTKDKPCKVRVVVFPPRNYRYDPPTIQIYESRLTDEESFKIMNDYRGPFYTAQHKSFLRRKIREQKKLLEELEGDAG